ncbi:MAG: SpoIIE family protein phosphatase [Spirochaetes bacterium]|nr:SpoIIE family protein phosphatase [Spirochaetota bacterium]
MPDTETNNDTVAEPKETPASETPPADSPPASDTPATDTDAAPVVNDSAPKAETAGASENTGPAVSDSATEPATPEQPPAVIKKTPAILRFFIGIKNSEIVTLSGKLFINILQGLRDIVFGIRDSIVRVYEFQKLGVLVMWKNREYTIQKKADFANLKPVRTFVSKYAKRAGLLPKQAHNVQLAIDEVSTNIIRHAYKDMEQGDIRISVVRREKAVDVIVSDSGVEFDWNKVLDPDLEKYVEVKRKGGLGIMLIRKLTDHAAYRREDGRNIVTLTFNLPITEKKILFAQFVKNVREQMSISAKFGVLGFLVVTFIGLAVYLALGYVRRGSAEEALFTKGVDSAKSIAATSAMNLEEDDPLILNEIVNTTKEQVSGIVYISIINRKRIIVADTSSDRTFEKYKEPSGIEPLGNRPRMVQRYKARNGDSILDVAVPVVLNKRVIGEVHLGISQASLTKAEQESSLWLRSLFVTIFIWFTALAGIMFLITLFISPIKKFTAEVAKVGTSDFQLDRISSGTLNEFKEIGNAFAGMIGRLKDQESQLTDQTRIKKEMQLAKDIQNTLLPKVIPQTEGFELAGNYMSALEMGGDYYDFFPVSDGVLGLVVGDVSGKGIGAAFIMAMCRTTMRIESKGIRRASDVLARINSLLVGDIKKGMYITIFYAVLDSEKHTINYASAGHNPMILYRGADDNTYFLNPKGFPVGLQLPSDDLFRKTIRSESITLAKDDLVFIYTDGITEAMNPERQQYGEPRLVQFIKEHHNLSTAEFSKALDADILEFSKGYPQSDDITYIVIKAKKNAADVRYEKVVALYALAAEEKIPPKKAAERLGISAEEYHKIHMVYRKKGLEGFKPSEEEMTPGALSHATLEQSRKIISIVREHPGFGTKRIQQMLATEAYGNEIMSEIVIAKELNKQKLNTRAQRERFTKRKMSDFSAATADLGKNQPQQ